MRSPLLARSGLSLDRLASFVAIVDAGGLAAASQGDPVRQSQLSRQLKELEEFFGGSLIERRRGVFRLTSTGRGLYEIARPTLTRLEDLERRCGAQLMEVHIGAGESVLVWLLLPRLGRLLSGESRVAFTLHNLQSEDITARLRDGRLDFGIVRHSAVAAGLPSLPLATVSHALFFPKSALSKGRAASPAQLLSRLPLATLEGNSAVSAALEEWAADRGIRLNLCLHCTSLVQAAAAVQHLGMAAVLPGWAESAFLPDSVARLDLPALKSLSGVLRLVWSKRQAGIRPFLSRLAKALASAVAASAAGPSS